MRFKNVLLASLMLLFVACGEKQEEAKIIESYKKGDIITLKGVEGGERKLKRVDGGFKLIDGDGKVLIVDFFGTFCPPCQKEADPLTRYQIDNIDKVSLIGLTMFEDVSNKHVVENFCQKYGAHYFISNDTLTHKRLAKSIKEDISYVKAMQLPFKVLIVDGKYQVIKDVWEGKKNNKFYIGAVGLKTIEDDVKKYLANKG